MTAIDWSSAGVSVVVPHYGQTEPTIEVVAGLQAQDHVGPIEIIVSDDNSPIPFPEGQGYTVVRRPVNGGFGTAVNSGASVATQPLLMILNSDVALDRWFVRRLLAEAAGHQPCIAGPRVMESGAPRVTTWRWPRTRGLTAEWLAPLARFHKQRWLDDFWGADMSAHDAPSPVPAEWIVGVCLLLPLDQFRGVGGFDEGFFMNCEETDLQRRLAEKAVPALYVPTVDLRHVGGGSSDPARASRWLTDARFRYFAKWGGARRLALGLAAATAVNFLWNVQRCIRGAEIQPWAEARQQWRLIHHGWVHRTEKLSA